MLGDSCGGPRHVVGGRDGQWRPAGFQDLVWPRSDRVIPLSYRGGTEAHQASACSRLGGSGRGLLFSLAGMVSGGGVPDYGVVVGGVAARVVHLLTQPSSCSGVYR
jgi:hypothetical protein